MGSWRLAAPRAAPPPLPRRARDVVLLGAYALACSALHSLLQRHYLSQCATPWLSLFALEPGPYCVLVRRALGALQWSPVLALPALA